jgi:hypothetical protein
MDLGALRARVLAVNMAAHGVPITVTRPAPDDTPITTTVDGLPLKGIWMTPASSDLPPGSRLQARSPIRILVVATADVPTAPRGTTVVAAWQPGGDESTWVVEGLDHQEADHLRLIVKAAA